MENRLKSIAEEYGRPLQPLFLPGGFSPEQWMWEILRARPEDYAERLGLAEADMNTMTERVAHLVDGAVQQRDAAKAAVGAFAEDIGRTVPDVARIIGRREAEKDSIPELLLALKEQIFRWRQF